MKLQGTSDWYVIYHYFILIDFHVYSINTETGLDPDKMKLICKGHVIEDGMCDHDLYTFFFCNAQKEYQIVHDIFD